MTALIVVLVVTGVSLLIAEAHVASYGLLGICGVAAFATAGVLAAETAGGSLLLALALVLPAAVVMTALVALATGRVLAVRRGRPRVGPEALIGRVGVVRQGDVVVSGERWRARSSLLEDEPELHDGEQVVVEQIQGLTLSVRRAEEWEVL
jgi:membrane-bound serine protease (ClpP class)